LYCFPNGWVYLKVCYLTSTHIFLEASRTRSLAAM